MFEHVVVLLGLDSRDDGAFDAVVGLHQKRALRSVTCAHLSPSGAPATAEAALAAGRLDARLGGLTVTSRALVGSASDLVSELLADTAADLLVMGRGTPQGDDLGLPGHHNTLRVASCSVLVVPSGARWRADEAVVGVDFSTHSGRALRAALGLFERVEAVAQYAPSSVGPHETEDQFRSHLLANMKEHLRDEVLPPQGVPEPTLRVVAGKRASVTLAETAGDRPLVVGSRGLSRVAALLLGSTAEGLVRLANGPVLIVRDRAHTRGLLDALAAR